MSSNIQDSGRKFINSDRGQQYLKNLAQKYKDKPVTIDIYKEGKKGLEKCGERRVHVNEIIAREEKG